MDWNEIASEFEVDGSLRDILIFDTTLADWEAVIERLRTLSPSAQFRIGDEVVPPPEDLSTVLLRGPYDVSPSFYFPLGDATLNCHLFDDAEIEFDLDPKEMGPHLLQPLVEFMTELGSVTNKSVHLIHEGNPKACILRFDPDSS